MDGKTSRRLRSEVCQEAEETMQTLVEHFHDSPHQNAQQSDTWMDKLLFHWSHERQDGKDRRTSAHDDT